jgi:hypothetical protein
MREFERIVQHLADIHKSAIVGIGAQIITYTLHNLSSPGRRVADHAGIGAALFRRQVFAHIQQRCRFDHRIEYVIEIVRQTGGHLPDLPVTLGIGKTPLQLEYLSNIADDEQRAP